MKTKAIIGYGGFGREVYHQMMDNDPTQQIEFFVDDKYVCSNTKPLSLLTENYEVVVAVGNPILRKNIIDNLPTNISFFTFIHKSVINLDKTNIIGEGSIICAGSILTTNITLGKHTHLNLHTTIGHDCVINDYFTTAPGVKISGNCNIGNQVYVGTNASLREKLTICDSVTIGLNAGVVKNIDVSGIYVGVPAKLK